MDAQLTEIEELREKLKRSETRYNMLMEHATDGIYIVDLDDHFIDVNSGLCKMLGYTASELLKMPMHDIIDPEQLKNDPLYQSGIEQKKMLVRERRFLRKDGSTVDVELNITLFAPNQLLVVSRDITQRKKMETELRNAELKFRTIAERSMVGIYIIQNGFYTYVNPRFAEIFGYDPEELLHSFPVVNVLHPDYREISNRYVTARLTGETDSVHYEAMGRRKDGHYNWVELYGTSTHIDGVPSIIGSMIDITERVQSNETLNRSEAYLGSILNNTNTAYLLFDKNFSILAFNQRTISFALQHHFFPSIGDSLTSFFPRAEYQQFYEQIDTVFNGLHVNYELNIPAEGGVEWHFDVRLFPIKNDAGQVFGGLFELYDITERKEAEFKLTEAYEQIQAQVNHIREMTWKQSHLIRSPIANLKGLINILAQDPDDGESLKYIYQELKRLDDIIIEMAGQSIADQAS